MTQPLLDTPEGPRFCPDCNLYMSVAEFGINRDRPDGRNRYCKTSVRNIMTAQRKRSKEMGSARKRALEKRLEAKQQRQLDGLITDEAETSAEVDAPEKDFTISELAALEIFRVKILKAIQAGARTRTEIAFAADLVSVRARRACERREGLKERLLAHEDGCGLTVYEQTVQAQLRLDQLGTMLGQLLTRREIRTTVALNGQRLFFPAVALKAVTQKKQRSLFETVGSNSFGPNVRAASPQFRRGARREATEGWKPSTSRVA